MFLPELQAVKISSINAINIAKRRERAGLDTLVKASKIAILTSISLGKLANEGSKKTLRKIETMPIAAHMNLKKSNKLMLMFPSLTVPIRISLADVDHLIEVGYFSNSESLETNTCSDPINLKTKLATDSTKNKLATDSTEATDYNVDDFDVIKDETFEVNRNMQRLNHQAAVFMGLIVGVVSDSSKYDCYSNFSPSNSKQDWNSIDYNLIVPSVLALNALSQRSWKPAANFPPAIIASLVHLMCHADSKASIVSQERSRVVNAAASLLMAAVSVDSGLSELIFFNLLAELQVITTKLALRHETFISHSTDDRKLTQSDNLTSIDSAMSLEGPFFGDYFKGFITKDCRDNEAFDTVENSSKLLSNHKELFSAFGLLAHILCSECGNSNDSLSNHVKKLMDNSPIKMKPNPTNSTALRQYESSQLATDSLSCYDQDTNNLIFRQYFPSVKLSNVISIDRNGHHDAAVSPLSTMSLLLASEKLLSPILIQSHVPFPLQNSSLCHKLSTSDMSSPDTSQPLKNDFLALVNCVFKLNGAKGQLFEFPSPDPPLIADLFTKPSSEWPIEPGSESYIDLRKLQLDLLEKADNCFSQV
jgi:hypothetical protein